MRRGFTLIELVVVVAIFAFLSAVLIPGFLHARVGAARPPEPAPTPAPTVEGTPFNVKSADLHIKLGVTHHLVGGDVYTRYEADCNGQYLLESPPDAEGEFSVSFPDGTAEARDVSLRFVTPTGPVEPPGVVYTQNGLVWRGRLPAPQVLALVTFVAQGRDRVYLSLPRVRRIEQLDIVVDLNGLTASAVTLPDQSFEPTTVEPHRLEWHYTDLVTDRSLLIDLPARETPLGQLMLLLRLVGLAVLLFGAGFWYLAELARPGFLTGFRWGHFLLLAMTYSLFFVVFAVLGLHGDLSVAHSIGLAALVSMPLLTLHVSRILDLRFALTRVLPLTAFTLLVVLSGVYGGLWRDYLFVSEVSIAIAFLTLTWRRWSMQRSAREREQAASHQRRVRREEAKDLLQLGSMPESVQQVQTLLDTADPDDRRTARQAVEAALSHWQDVLEARQQWLDAPDGRAESLAHRLKAAANLVQRRGAELAALRLPPSRWHCASCGVASSPTEFCPHCGRRQPRPVDCPSCSAHFVWPVMANQPTLCCTRCGTQLSFSEVA